MPLLNSAMGLPASFFFFPLFPVHFAHFLHKIVAYRARSTEFSVLWDCCLEYCYCYSIKYAPRAFYSHD